MALLYPFIAVSRHPLPNNRWQMLLDFGGGCIAYVAANNCVQDSRAPQLELHGLQGTLAVNLLDMSAPIDVLRAGGAWESVFLSRTGRASGPDHLLGVQELVDCIQNDSPSRLSATHAIHVLDIIEQAAQSAAQGKTLEIANGVNE